LHSVDGLIFEEQLIVLGDGDQEQDSSDILEAVDPFLSLGSLSTNVKHAISQILNDEGGFCDTGGFDSRPEDVLVIWHVVMGSDAVY